MKVACDREKLWHAFQTASGVAPSRSPKPILQNVKMDVSGDGATLTATDLEVGIRIELTGLDVQAPGSVVLPTTRFGLILRETSDEKILLETDDRGTVVRGQRSEFRLPGENPDEFPEVAVFQDEKYHEMPVRFFRELIRRTVFATESESSRYALGGVLLELTADGIIGVGTDGRRLACQKGPAKSVAGHETGDNTTIVPMRALQLMERALANNEEMVQVATHDNDVLVRCQKVTIYSRLVEGRYPQWRDVFPRHEGAAKIEMNVGPFHTAVRQAAIVTSEERRGVEFNFGDGKVVMTAHGAELGESRVEMPIAYDGPEVPINLDPRYVSDFLKVLDPDQTFTLELKDSESAVVCSTDDGYGYVIMPLARGH